MGQTALYEEDNVLWVIIMGLTMQGDRSHWEKQKTRTIVVCEHVCTHVGWLEGGVYSEAQLAEWGHIHAWGENGLCCGVSRPVDISEMASPTATQAGTPPQWSSITPLFWAIPLSTKSFVKAFIQCGEY